MSNDKRLALVTGGTGGLGQAICKRLADDGFVALAFGVCGDQRLDCRAECDDTSLEPTVPVQHHAFDGASIRERSEHVPCYP